MERRNDMAAHDTANTRRSPASASPRAPLWIATWLSAILAGCATPNEPPHVASTPTTQALKKLPRKSGEPVTVSIYEFRSSVSDVSARSATDMLKTSLMQSGQFRVVERSRVNEGVIREKQLNSQGMSTGKSARQPLRDARYLFEGAVTEANASEKQSSGAINIAGLEFGGGTNTDTIAIDVRIVDVATGDIVDSITVKKTVKADNSYVGGFGALLGNVLAQKGRSATYVPDARANSSRREGVDSALRAAIDVAVLELARRFQP
jgi:curli biogenesis system outer membrane secretion channel CsgG